MKRIKQWLLEKWCDWIHKPIRLPAYKQGTNEQIGEVVFCKKCSQ